jgi:hypothetical protein
MSESVYRIYGVSYENELDYFRDVLVKQIVISSIRVSIHMHGLN